MVPVAFLHLGSPLKEVTDAVSFMCSQIPKHWIFIRTCLEEIFETCVRITSVEPHPLMLVSVIFFYKYYIPTFKSQKKLSFFFNVVCLLLGVVWLMTEWNKHIKGLKNNNYLLGQKHNLQYLLGQKHNLQYLLGQKHNLQYLLRQKHNL